MMQDKFLRSNSTDTSQGVMTVNGVIRKTFVLLLLVIVSGSLTMMNQVGMPALMISFVGSFVLAIITVFKPTAAPITAPLYAIVQGVLLGAVTQQLSLLYPGIANQAILATVFVFFTMLFLYQARIIRVTEKFKSVIMTAMFAVIGLYVFNFILSFAGISLLPNSGPMAILISAGVALLAAFVLLLDFDMIESLAHEKAPMYMEWYSSFSLLVTIVWLYIELLRLISLIRGSE